MNYSFDQELKNLLDVIERQSLKRYDDVFYADYDKLKRERSLMEFVWCYCYYPSYAPRLLERLKEIVPNAKKYVSTLARVNKRFEIDNLYESWERAVQAAEYIQDEDIPIVYSMENSCDWKYNVLYVNNVDGDMWCGLLFPKKCIDEVECIRMRLSSTDNDGGIWGKVYDYEKDDIKKHCRSVFEKYPSFNAEDDWYIFSPFKHPLILCGMNDTRMNISIESDGKEFEIKPVYAMCEGPFKRWLENSKFKLELGDSEKYIIDTRHGTMTLA